VRDFDFRLKRNWRDLVEDMTDDLLEEAGEAVRDQARVNASSISNDTDAIVSNDVESDSEGHYVDVGYDKHHPGFTLWWQEVGTSKFPPQPHLRPAAARKVI
jgi:hypothetical protein